MVAAGLPFSTSVTAEADATHANTPTTDNTCFFIVVSPVFFPLGYFVKAGLTASAGTIKTSGESEKHCGMFRVSKLK